MMKQLTDNSLLIIDEMIQVETRILKNMGNVQGEANDVVAEIVRVSNWRIEKLRELRSHLSIREEVK